MRFLLARSRAGRLLLATGLVAVLIPVAVVLAVGNESGFEDDDANLVQNGLTTVDWNSFAPTTWTGTAPNRRSSKVLANGWAFTGIEDNFNSTGDSAFAGGTKQDKDCATVGTAKASNKDDIKRVYFASNTVNGHVYLNLAWVRIPQNSTSSSAHVAFEFNQGSTACPAGSDGLVRRTTANGGDMLLVYDFEGGAVAPTIRLSRWIASGACEVSSNSPPCWSVAQTLGAGVAEAAVNRGAGNTVTDTIAPVPPELLNDSEFGEAGIDLTDAGVFPPGQCVNFGQGFAVSRSSGTSSQAQMKDLVGPGEVNIQNCGNVIIRKVTDPSPDATDTTFNYTTTGGLNPATFGLKNGESRDYGGTVLAPRSYSVTETDPSPDFVLTDLDCSASDTSHGTTISTNLATGTVSFNLNPLDTVDCTYTNTLQRGALRILKKSTKSGNPLVSQPGAVFSYDSSTVTDNGTGDEDSTVGEVCVSGLLPGTYTVNETSPPPGYGDAAQTDQTAVVVVGTNCTDNQPSDANSATFTNPPLSDIQVNFRDGGSGETSATITCDNTTGTGSDTPATDWDTSRTVTGVEAPATVNCQIVIDP